MLLKLSAILFATALAATSVSLIWQSSTGSEVVDVSELPDASETLTGPQKGRLSEDESVNVSGPSLAASDAETGRAVEQRLSGAMATTGGDLEFALIWDGKSDLDLAVRNPSRQETNAKSPCAGGGVMDVDANSTPLTAEGTRRMAQGLVAGRHTMIALPDSHFDGRRRKLWYGADSLFTTQPVEHIYFERPKAGSYTVLVHCYSWREPNRQPIGYVVQARSRGTVIRELKGTIGPDSYVDVGAESVIAMEIEYR